MRPRLILEHVAHHLVAGLLGRHHLRGVRHKAVGDLRVELLEGCLRRLERLHKFLLCLHNRGKRASPHKQVRQQFVRPVCGSHGTGTQRCERKECRLVHCHQPCRHRHHIRIASVVADVQHRLPYRAVLRDGEHIRVKDIGKAVELTAVGNAGIKQIGFRFRIAQAVHTLGGL